jgi:hypothetical protein
MKKLITELRKSTENAICRYKRRWPNMKYPAVVLVILLCVTIFHAGCKELPRGNCWPPELSKRVPLGLTFALEMALSPNGTIPRLVGAGLLSCNDIQSITYGPAYQIVWLNRKVPSASSEDIFIFHDSYMFGLYCHEQVMGGVEFDKRFSIWQLVGGSTSSGPFEALDALENYLGPDFTDCTRGLISDKQGITRFYPLYLEPSYIWGNTEGKKVGEFSLTKEEFFEWYHNNIDLDS